MADQIQKVIIAGGSGLIGKALSKHLSEKGYEVSILSRNPKKILSYNAFYWNPEKMEMDEKAIQDQDIVINLAGESIAAKYWTRKRKKQLIDSRVKPIELLQNALAKTENKPEKIISASAIGYYGNRPGEKLDEYAPPGKGFMSEICKRWEKAADNLAEPVIKLRIGIVLTAKGGYLPQMQKILKKGFNVILGSGKQRVSWIHMKDLIAAIEFLLLNEETEGVYNLTTPNSVDTYEMQVQIAKTIGKTPIKFRIPSKPIKVLMGDFSELFLNDQNIYPERLLKTGFSFKYANLNDALQ
jgi:uncharacterized protein (TIGR01777 family)